MDFERDDSQPNVLKMRPTIDAGGKKLRREGPCYICGAHTRYRYSGLHARYGDAWLDRHFTATERAERVQMLWSDEFLYSRVGGGTLLRSMLKFTCCQCQGQLESHWRAREVWFKAEADRRSRKFAAWLNSHGV